MVDHKSSARVNKYIHRFCNTEFGNLTFTAQQRALICVLFLRGPQTPGELRTRTNRLADFSDVNEVEATLVQLQNLQGESLVKKLERQPGKRDSRYVHLLANTQDIDAAETAQMAQIAQINNVMPAGNAASVNNNALAERVTLLEKQVADLAEQVTCLTELLGEITCLSSNAGDHLQ